MRGLTLIQPYASAIFLPEPDRKDVENRTWPPPASILGQRIAIHAGVKKPDPAWGLPDGIDFGPLDELPRGSILGTARVVGALDRRSPIGAGWIGRRVFLPELTALGDRDRGRLCILDSSRWWVGPVGWLLDDVRACAVPVACKGAMGLWTVPDDVRAHVELQTARAA